VNTSTIDIHTHVVPYDFPAYAGTSSGASWPHMCASPQCNHRNVMIDGKLFRTVSHECWDVEQRLHHMEKTGIGRQVLSPMPELLSYWMPAQDALVLCRHINQTMAEMVAQAPERFSALGCVPLQDPDLAARELESLMKMGTFRGVEIGTNIDDVVIGDPRFEPFFAAAEELGASIFVHPLRAVGLNRLVGPPGLIQLVAFPGETALAAASLLTGGVLERHPRLRIAFSHGAGGFALTLPRLAAGWEQLGLQHQRSPWEQARSLFYDTLVYDGPTLAHLISTFGATQLCIGTDHPFLIQDTQPVQRLDEVELDHETRHLLLSGNAMRFLGETSPALSHHHV
jgi:aminocarboxymuconate-semialdehyde decarboxylase